MISRSTLLHSRFGFSIFLLPVFLLALLTIEHIDVVNSLIVFIVLHMFLYPASNGYNSYYDRDTESIGGLRTPPPVTPDLLWFSFFLDAVGTLLAFLVSPFFALACFVYGLASKAYSWHAIRIKKYGVPGWIYVAVGQGSVMFLLVVFSVAKISLCDLVQFRYLFPALLTGLYLLGFYPLTQIYQHTEDARRNDMTVSRLAGVGGTFVIAVAGIGLAVIGFVGYFYIYYNVKTAMFFLLCIIPATVHFVVWIVTWVRHASGIDYTHLARMHILAAAGLNLFSIVTIAVR